MAMKLLTGITDEQAEELVSEHKKRFINPHFNDDKKYIYSSRFIVVWDVDEDNFVAYNDKFHQDLIDSVLNKEEKTIELPVKWFIDDKGRHHDCKIHLGNEAIEKLASEVLKRLPESLKIPLYREDDPNKYNSEGNILLREFQKKQTKEVLCKK